MVVFGTDERINKYYYNKDMNTNNKNDNSNNNNEKNINEIIDIIEGLIAKAKPYNGE